MVMDDNGKEVTGDKWKVLTRDKGKMMIMS